MKAGILSKTSMKVSEYFTTAFTHAQVNSGIKSFDSGRFVGVLHYHSYYFQALSYLCLAIEKYSAVRETSRGLGEAIGYYEKTLKLLESCKAIVMTIPASY